MPYAMSRWLLRRVNRVDRQPAIFYFHPWEIDRGAAPGPRHRRQDALSALRQPAIEWSAACGKLLFDFEWGRVDEVLLEAA